MSAQQFMEMLFGKLPEFFKNEDELRALWSAPDTRAKLLQGLAEKGFGHDQLAEMQKIINAEKSDLFDVLAHVAYALPPLTREERAAHAKVDISTQFNSKQQAFLDFVLSQYVKVGVDELDRRKTHPAAHPQVPRHSRRRSRPRPPRRHPNPVLRLPEVPVRTLRRAIRNAFSVIFHEKASTVKRESRIFFVRRHGLF